MTMNIYIYIYSWLHCLGYRIFSYIYIYHVHVLLESGFAPGAADTSVRSKDMSHGAVANDEDLMMK
jgi:hypothetical protein